LRPLIGGEQKDISSVRTRGEHHPSDTRNASRGGEIGDDHGELADQLLGRLDVREYRALRAAETNGQFEELVRTIDVLGVNDAGDAQIDLAELLDADGAWTGFLLRRNRRPGLGAPFAP